MSEVDGADAYGGRQWDRHQEVVAVNVDEGDCAGAERVAWLRDLYTEHYHDIYKYCRSRCESRDEALDACQEVFLRALVSSAKLRDHPKPRAWLFTTAFNVTSEEWKDRRRRRRAYRMVGDLQDRADPVQDRQDFARTEEALERMWRALDNLDASQQRILWLSLDGIPHRAIAEEFGISVNAVGTRLHRARRALRKEMELLEPRALSNGGGL